MNKSATSKPHASAPVTAAGDAAASARPIPKACKLGELLCRRKHITPEQLAEALHEQATASPRKQLAQILLDNQVVSSTIMAQALAESTGTPFVTLSAAMIQADALTSLPIDFMEKQNVLPMSLVEGWLTIAVEQFSNLFLHEEIAHRSGARVQIIAAEAQNIRSVRHAVLQQDFGDVSKGGDVAEENLDSLLGPMADDDLKVVADTPSMDEDDLEATATDSPVVKIVNYILRTAVEARASDIHIEPQEKNFRVRFRVDGELMESIHPPARMLPAVVSRIKILSGMDISERRLPQDGGMTATLAGRPIDLRVSTMSTKSGEKVVMRIVDRDAAVKGLDSLGFDEQMLRKFRKATQASNGIVLVTGPTGSGKTTTLYSALIEIVSAKTNISTIEDPVERKLAGTNQFQVHPQAGFTFAAALRSLLRQDPDVIMVGEIRDPETAKLATEAALTGHLVLSTLHTNDAPTAIPRLINMGVEPYLVAASLRAVLAQRLVKQICPHCRISESLGETEKMALGELCKGHCPIEVAFHGKGCNRCRNTGYRGRAGVFEFLGLGEEMLSQISREPDMSQLRENARKRGWTTLLDDGLEKVRQGTISIASLLEIVSHSQE